MATDAGKKGQDEQEQHTVLFPAGGGCFAAGIYGQNGGPVRTRMRRQSVLPTKPPPVLDELDGRNRQIPGL